MSELLSQIKTVEADALFDADDLSSVDLMLVNNEDSFRDVQNELEQDNTFVILTLDAEDLLDKENLVREIFYLICENPAPENASIIENIELIEEELGEMQTCVLCCQDFLNCSEEAQAVLLELAIVSQSFKLLLLFEQQPGILQNEALWKVLSSRALWIGQVSFSPLENEETESSAVLASSDRAKVYEPRQAQGDGEVGQQKPRVWYQMIPKYHLGAGLILVMLVIALWNMDLTKTREKTIDLNAENKSLQASQQSKSKQKEELSTALETESSVDVEVTNQDAETVELNSESVIEVTQVEEVIEEVEEVVVIDEPVERSAPKIEQRVVIENEVGQEPVVSVSQKPLEPATKSKTEPKAKSTEDWSPYQSDAWVKGINSKYYTLQILASHNEQGIRDFLTERGVSSEYAVYTTEKDGKPWHVIIYGVYETHEFASLAREDLPAYLKPYSPWIRSVSSVQKSLQ
jgi:septal ring-binding cell division protein DamX